MNINPIPPAFKGTIVVPNVGKLNESQQACVLRLHGSSIKGNSDARVINKNFDLDLQNMRDLENAGIEEYTYVRNADTWEKMMIAQHQKV